MVELAPTVLIVLGLIAAITLAIVGPFSVAKPPNMRRCRRPRDGT